MLNSWLEAVDRKIVINDNIQNGRSFVEDGSIYMTQDDFYKILFYIGGDFDEKVRIACNIAKSKIHRYIDTRIIILQQANNIEKDIRLWKAMIQAMELEVGVPGRNC